MAGATLAITGLTFGGIRFPWLSAQVLAPLIIGIVLLCAFLVYERMVPLEPSIPWEVVNNWTSLSGYVFHGYLLHLDVRKLTLSPTDTSAPSSTALQV